ncbi:Cytochrome P450 monooxygenase TRI13 [Cladobotryum mycophilum]|uniref:Cytochrome P450 monooxygenase TRI13 n=1 Tax=Cladobotryum mycophilum TaxID=491253 RepID=A0ABR0SZJ4_9HYPO
MAVISTLSAAVPKTPLTISAVTLFIIAAIGLLYRALLPKPIPGIPYKKSSARRILGDAPDVLRWNKETKEIWSYIRNLAIELDSPVIQVFMRPLGKPWVILCDFREAQDIQMYRSNDFDRARVLEDIFGSLLPNCHVWMPSNDKFKAHRNLIRDTMSPAFLNGVVGPVIHAKTQSMLTLWRERARLAQGRPFEGDHDLFRATLDVILSATFELEAGSIAAQTKLLSRLDTIALPADVDTPVEFPTAKDPQEFTSIRSLLDSVEIALNSPFPTAHLSFALNFYPELSSARKYKDGMIAERVQRAWKKFGENADQDDKVACAVDLLIQRQAQMAKKENRNLGYDVQAIKGELFGFIAAGHETTSTTICWAVKYLTEYPEVQKKLRSILRATYKRAVDAREPPTAEEIAKTTIPYLDAFIEESHRCGNTVPTIVRHAIRDTTVLGYKIPKGTDVFMLTNGPSYQSPAFSVNESERSKTSHDSKDKFGSWNSSDIHLFIPERWIVKEQNGEERFDPRAGPAHPYGTGLRGCFGSKFAALELKIIITLILWSFDLQEIPPPLRGFEGHDKNTKRAQKVFIRLAEVN